MHADELFRGERSSLNEDLRRAIEDLHLVIKASQDEEVDEILEYARHFAMSMWLSAMSLNSMWETPFDFSGHGWGVKFHGISCAMLACREIMEKYLVFKWIYNESGVSEENYLKWRIASWAFEDRLAVVSDAGKEKIAQNIKERDILIKQFKNLKRAMGVEEGSINDSVEKLKKGKAVGRPNWDILFEHAGLKPMYNTYSLMCDFAHSGAFAVYAVANTSDMQAQMQRCKVSAWFAMMFIYMFIACYVNIFEKSRVAVGSCPRLRFRVELWHKIAKDTAEKLYKAA
jgi:hypothetical protein